jgi:murein DD-endopeptidase MepM/ murein hydrolase activator NlpD
VKGLGVLNALFTGLDFYRGLQEGESVGKAASGAGASLAGSIVGGVLGSALGPLGTFAGASLGGFVGGWLGDRAYETATGEGKNVSQKLEQRRKKQLEKQGLFEGKDSFSEVINKFDIAVSKFEKIILSGNFGSVKESSTEKEQALQDSDAIEPTDSIQTGNDPTDTGEQLGDFEASGGTIPGKPDSGFRSSRRPKHNGNDYFINVGTPISVIQPGTVTVADMNYDPRGWGALVEIRHNDGSLSRYAHLSKIKVSRNEKIEPGRVIGYTGGRAGAPGSGNSEGPHLHFEYLSKGSNVDPTEPAKRLFRFGGSVKVKPKASPSQSMVPGSGSLSGPSEQKNQLPTKAEVKPQSSTIAGNQQVSMLSSIDGNESMYVPKVSPEQIVSSNNANLNQAAQNIRYYPTYNQPQSSITIMTPITSGGSNRSPIVIPSSSSSGSSGTLENNMNFSEGFIVNSFAKIALLTNLSSS